MFGRKIRGAWLVAGVLGCVLASERAARALECTTSICAGNPCTISGKHQLSTPCTLDFGSKNVTLAATASLESPDGGKLLLHAGSLTARGLIQAFDGNIGITTDGDFKLAGTTTSGRIVADGTFGSIDISAGGSATMGGISVSANGFFGLVSIAGASVVLNGAEVSADGGSGGAGEVDITSTDGPVTIAHVVHAKGIADFEDGGTINVQAAGPLNLTAPLNVIALQDGSGGYLTLQADGDMSIGDTLLADGLQSGDGGVVTLTGKGDVNINGVVSATGSGSGTLGGTIDVVAGANHALRVNRALHAATSASGTSDGQIDLGPACSAVVAAPVLTTSLAGGGAISIQYRQSLDASAGSLDADADGGVTINCRCVDPNVDGVCDGGCVVSPTGLGPGNVDPPADIEPVALGPCQGCPNGVVEPELGEQCDDGNFDNFDGCDNQCQVTGCGNGIVEPGEQCDDGNRVDGDCCSSTCQLEPDGSPCSDGNLCTAGDSCHSGACVGDPSPQASCRQAISSSLLVKKGTTPALNAFTWRARYAQGPPTSFGNPTMTTDYAVCLYDDADATPALRLSLNVPGGGVCNGKPCWKAAGSGFSYSDSKLTASSVQQLKLGGGTLGRATLSAKAKGGGLLVPPLPLTTGVKVQLKSSVGSCWEAHYAAPLRNDSSQFKATK
jgi:cysteine-rich repeat protein